VQFYRPRRKELMRSGWFSGSVTVFTKRERPQLLFVMCGTVTRQGCNRTS